MHLLTRLLVLIFFIVAPFDGSSAFAESETTVLKGRIIRALAVDPQDINHILVGNKASKPGSALVFQSRDGGKTWKTLNGGKSLSPMAADVQSVVAVGLDRILAGTWKFGLYLSRDAGKNFENVESFPSQDIRDLQVVTRNGKTIIYAATARNGVQESRDLGETWTALGPGKQFFWSITTDERGNLYAVSLEKAIFCHCNGEKAWDKIFDAENAYGLAATALSNVLAVAAETGAYLSGDNGTNWTKLDALKGEKLSDARYLRSDPSGVLFGSWSNGLIVVDKGSGEIKRRLLKGAPVVHVNIAGDKVLAGTWGQGLKILPLSAVTP